MQRPFRPNAAQQAADHLTTHHELTPRAFGGFLEPYTGVLVIPAPSSAPALFPPDHLLPVPPTFWRIVLWSSAKCEITISQEQMRDLQITMVDAGIYPAFTLKGTAGQLTMHITGSTPCSVSCLVYAVTGLPPNELIG